MPHPQGPYPQPSLDETSLERAQKTLGNFTVGNTRSFGLAHNDQFLLDEHFLGVMQKELTGGMNGEGVDQAGQARFITKMHNGWTETRNRMRNVTRLALGVSAVVALASGPVWPLVVIGIAWAAKHRKNSTAKADYKKDMEKFVLSRKLIVETSHMAVREPEDMKAVYDVVGEALTRTEERMKTLRNNKWTPFFWPKGGLPGFSADKVAENEDKLKNLREYWENYGDVMGFRQPQNANPQSNINAQFGNNTNMTNTPPQNPPRNPSNPASMPRTPI